ncbi:hypothetical protein GF325_07945 [Candidatus Bathyarchaeota archaeon]|nr:hypothetical protein [Candidatus Bathyarchaeota archaeon]
MKITLFLFKNDVLRDLLDAPDNKSFSKECGKKNAIKNIRPGNFKKLEK